MAITFDGASSKLEHTTAGGLDNNTYTLCVWEYAAGLGEGSFGRIFVTPEAGGSITYSHADSANVLRFSQAYSSVAGEWDIAATDNQWNAVAISFDRSSDTTTPTVRVNFASSTPTLFSDSSGTATTAATGYCVGNRSNAQRTWDGRLAHFQYFNVILNAAEMDMALKFPGSVRRGLQLWLPMYHATYVADLSGNGRNGTATALATSDGPPCGAAFVGLGWPGWMGNFTAAAAPGGGHQHSKIRRHPNFSKLVGKVA